jgi:5-methyltetrahydropteroyltriglutamate--homocysteine methyltransferase
MSVEPTPLSSPEHVFPFHAGHIGGFPRLGAQRELKFALEAFWCGESDAHALQSVARAIRMENWQRQHAAGLDFITVGDFALFDHVLETLALLNALPKRFTTGMQSDRLVHSFVYVHGTEEQYPMEMTKWFDTNYHYLVPEYTPEMSLADCVERCGGTLFEEVEEARTFGMPLKVTLLGPVSLLWLGRERHGLEDRLSLLPKFVDAYQVILRALHEQGVACVQVDEPILAVDLGQPWIDAFVPTYEALAKHAPPLLLATYFGGIARHAGWLGRLPIAGVHIDAVRAPEQIECVAQALSNEQILSIGIVDGRNVYRNDLNHSLAILDKARAYHSGALWVAPSCSLLHVPVDLSLETELDNELYSWLAFATQKLDEVVLLTRALRDEVEGREARSRVCDAASAALAARQKSVRAYQPTVRARVAALPENIRRRAPYAERAKLQRATLALPILPTTTIGSCPQTAAIRSLRHAFRQGIIGQLEYLQGMRAQIANAIKEQEDLGLDVLVHGEAERSDMVEYFAEWLWGFALTSHGWVQNYGACCVRPPLLYGDVSLPEPMTAGWSSYAQSLSTRPVKGMLTGPVTLMQWSFVRDDLPRSQVALQVALALQDEVRALEKAGLRIIQIDEPALRESLPLEAIDWPAHLNWAVRAFHVVCAGVSDATQIHTHMCYADCHEILPAVAGLDADVLSIETARSPGELLAALAHYAYPNAIGPGVYDSHSSRIPTTESISDLLAAAVSRVPIEHLWVNPDCGLKSRTWGEARAALRNMVEAARQMRAALGHSTDEAFTTPVTALAS